MSEMFHLGFEIDSTPLKQAGADAQKAAEQITKLGDAEQKLATEASKAGAALQKTGTEAQKLATDSAKAGDALKTVGAEAQKTTQAVTSTGKAVEAASKANRESTDSAKAFQDSLRQMSGVLKVNQNDLQGLSDLLRGRGGLVGGIDGALGAIGRMSSALGPLGIALGGTALAVGGIAVGFNTVVKPLAEAQDRMLQFEARMRNALGSSMAATETMRKLYDATQRTGLGFRETADAFLRMARNGEALGATQDQMIKLADTVQKLGAVSGASRGEIGSGMLQLSQALASGKLNGDELRAIMENMPALAKAIADGLGVSVGQIRAMGAAGELTGEKVFRAILTASTKANEEFARLPDTIERSNQRAADAWEKLLATLGEKWKASSFVREVTDFFTNTVNNAAELLAQKTPQEQFEDARRALMVGGRRLRPIDESGNVTMESDDDFIARRMETLGPDNPLVRAYQAQVDARQRRFDENIAAGRVAEEREANMPVTRAIELGMNQYDDFRKKLRAASEDVEKLDNAVYILNARIAAGTASAVDRSRLPDLQRQLSIARAEVEGMVQGVGKLQRELSDQQRAQIMGGGQGGTQIVAQAIQQQRAARSAVGDADAGSLDQYIGIGVRQAAIRGEEQIRTLDRQTDAQKRLIATVGLSREEAIKFEAAQEAAQKSLELFGQLGGSVAKKFQEEYTGALIESKTRALDFANAQARLNEQMQIDILRAQSGAVGNGYEQRRIAAMRQADNTALRDPVLARMQRERFGLQEDSTADAQINGAQRNAATSRSLAVVGITAAQQREIELRSRIDAARRNAPDGKRDDLERSMREEDEARQSREYAAQETALERQLTLIEGRRSLIGKFGDELRVQTAIMQKHAQLQAEGVPPEVMARQLAITAEIEKQTIAYERQKRAVEAIPLALQRGMDALGNSIVTGLETSLASGSKAGWKAFREAFGDTARRIGAELTYEIGIRPFIEAVKNMAVTFGTKIAQSVFGGLGFGGGGGASLPSGSFTAPPVLTALGASFDYGGVRKFAAGGAFTNSVVSSPTLFAFANGGALGLMGEAGPEAVMPLRRGSDGSLGVQSNGGGGGVSVVVNDMRSDTKAPEIKVAEGRGPDNRRMIQIMVRDEFRRAVRSGELDTEMASNFGVGRTVARK